ncbi:hypothetical protein SDC9_150018 [bioreactor metagenome]|uniref:Uncharacterized protein n=1 Tax=bioreactor metagenome TaxID=1076179 RepID=A0A645ELC8_9ZZZZ
MKAYNRYEGNKYYFNVDYKFDDEYCFEKFRRLDKQTIEEVSNLLGIKRDASLRTLMEIVIPKVGEFLNLDKDFSYKDLFYCIYEKKLEENNINRIQLYDFNKVIDAVNKNINTSKNLTLNTEIRPIISLQKNKMSKLLTNYFLKDFKNQG